MLYHFPSEPIELKDLRRSALDELRWRLRVPVVRQFGAASRELFAIVVRCEACHHVSGAVSGLASSTFDTSWGQLLEHFQSDELWQQKQAMPSSCQSCMGNRISPISAFFAKYVPSLQKDFQAEFIFRRGRVHQTRLFLMAPDGSARSVEPSEFHSTNFPVLSVRAAWRRVVGEELFAQTVSAFEVERGYEIGIRPYTDSTWHAHGLNTQLEELVSEKEKSGYDVVTFLREIDEMDLGLSHHDLCVTWLGAYAADIVQGGIEPFVLINSDQFISVFSHEAQRLGLNVERVGEPSELMVRLSHDGLFVVVSIAKTLLKTIHSGLSFADGVVAYFGRELSGIRAGAEAAKLVREALPMLEVQIKNGTTLLLSSPDGAAVCEFDAIAFGTEYDLRQPEEFELGFRQIAPAFVPLALTLTPPVAGQVSRVVRRV